MSAVLPTYNRYDLTFVEGSGARLTTDKGESYLDFAGGIAVCALGHAHPVLVQALKDQAEKLWHVSNLYTIPGQERLAARLAEVTFADKVFLSNSGAEAMECALKAARRYHHVTGHPERTRFITFEGSFHGRTMTTIAAAGQAKLVDGFGPLLEAFDRVAFADHEALKAAVTEETAGVVVEPIFGEGGIRPLPPQCLRGLRELCDEHGILLILDEVQTGVGRTGKLFAHEWAGIRPDIMAVAKGIGGGFPLGACLMTEEAAAGMTAGTHGSTYGGNPLAMAVGNAVLDVVLAEGFLDNVVQRGLQLRQGLAALTDAYPGVIEEIRGEGLMLGIRVRVPNGDLIAALKTEKMLTVPAGDNAVRLLPPLIVTEDDVRDALHKIECACEAITKRDADQGAAA